MGSSPGRYLLFDFFGTLVDYHDSRTGQGYRCSYDLLLRLGAELSYADFLAVWSRTFEEFDRRSDADDHEFSMFDGTGVFLHRALGRRPEPDAVAAFAAEYLREWNTGVRYPTGIAELVRDLAGDHRLAVVSNTHQPDLVPNHLAAMGVAGYFDAVITSVEVGWRKPHPAIYAETLRVLGIEASAAVFIGDSYRPDFVGPRRAGIPAYLIDPRRRAPVPADRRLASVFDLPARLRTPQPPGQPAGDRSVEGGDRSVGAGGRTDEGEHRAAASST